MTTLTRWPVPLKDRPAVREHVERARALEEHLEAREAELESARNQLLHHRASRMLDDPAARSAIDNAEATCLENEIAGLETDCAALRAAVGIHRKQADSVRAHERAVLGGEIELAARHVVAEMQPLVERVLTLNTELAALRSRNPTGHMPPATIGDYLRRWLEVVTPFLGRTHTDHRARLT